MQRAAEASEENLEYYYSQIVYIYSLYTELSKIFAEKLRPLYRSLNEHTTKSLEEKQRMATSGLILRLFKSLSFLHHLIMSTDKKTERVKHKSEQLGLID